MPKSIASDIDEANKKAVERILAAEAELIDMKPAIEAIPGYKENLITYAGPPIEWKRMCFTQKFAIKNVTVYEGLAESPEKAEQLIERGEILVEPNHKYGNVSGMCGVTAASFPVFVIENKVHGNTAFDWQQTDMTAFGDVYERASEIDFVKKILAPVMKVAIKEAKGINVKQLLVMGLQMGDELHGTFDASRGILVNWIFPHILRTDFAKDILAQVGDYFMSREGRWYCGNLMMGACKVMMDTARGIKYSSVVTAMSRNGVEFGIQVSGLDDQWFTGPAGEIKGFTFPGFKEEDSTLDIGDSAISESRVWEEQRCLPRRPKPG